MKTSYELAMERLNKSAPATKVSAGQKQQLADLDSRYAAKIAERELALQDEITRLGSSRDFEKVEKVRQQLVHERKSLQAELEDKKEKIRQAKS